MRFKVRTNELLPMLAARGHSWNPGKSPNRPEKGGIDAVKCWGRQDAVGPGHGKKWASESSGGILFLLRKRKGKRAAMNVCKG